jgi:hypothetical protein
MGLKSLASRMVARSTNIEFYSMETPVYRDPTGHMHSLEREELENNYAADARLPGTTSDTRLSRGAVEIMENMENCPYNLRRSRRLNCNQ